MSQDNRRRFFRIVDALGVAYRVISDKNTTLKKIQDNDGEAEFINTHSLVEGYNQTIEDCLKDVQTRDPKAAMAIDQLNKKLDAILMVLELDNLMAHTASHKIEQASISASGIAFPVEEKLLPNTHLALDLLLRPSSQHIKALGKVIACDSLQEESQYYLRVEFIEMTDKDRESLIQHIVQRQGALLRALKSEIDDL